MNKRLLEVAKLIDKCNMVIDVGCDHALLSIFLIQNKICKNVINIDCNVLPLKNGENNVKKIGLEKNIKFILNNGLSNLNIGDIVDYITICGMGSQNIIEIIIHSTINPKKYILQSNNNSPKLRKWLSNNSYKIIDEKIVYENKIYYEIIMIEAGDTNIINDVDLYIGPILKNNNNLILKNYLLNKYNYLSKYNYNIVNRELKEEYEIIKNYCYEKKWIS